MWTNHIAIQHLFKGKNFRRRLSRRLRKLQYNEVSLEYIPDRKKTNNNRRIINANFWLESWTVTDAPVDRSICWRVLPTCYWHAPRSRKRPWLRVPICYICLRREKLRQAHVAHSDIHHLSSVPATGEGRQLPRSAMPTSTIADYKALLMNLS